MPAAISARLLDRLPGSPCSVQVAGVALPNACPAERAVAAAQDYLLSRGASMVVVSRGSKGCTAKSGELPCESPRPTRAGNSPQPDQPTLVVHQSLDSLPLKSRRYGPTRPP